MKGLYENSHPLEGRPSVDQRERLEDFLDELTLICRRYNLLLDGYVEGETIQVLDLDSGNVVGLNLLYTVQERTGKVVAYDCEHSILDGVWLVDAEDGPVEQHTLVERARARSRRGAFRRLT